MEIEKIKQDAWLGFNLLGLFILAGQLFITLFGVTYIVAGEKISLMFFAGLLIPLACFITAYGFKKSYLWAWYSASSIATLILISGLSNLVKVDLSGLMPTLISIFIFSFLLKIRINYMAHNA